MTDSSAICIGSYHNLCNIRRLYLHEIREWGYIGAPECWWKLFVCSILNRMSYNNSQRLHSSPPPTHPHFFFFFFLFHHIWDSFITSDVCLCVTLDYVSQTIYVILFIFVIFNGNIYANNHHGSFHICEKFLIYNNFHIWRLPNGYKCKKGHKYKNESAVTNVKSMFSLNQHESLVTLAVRMTDSYAIRFGAYHNLPQIRE